MWVYIVTWCINSYMTVPCQQSQPYMDEFNIMHYPIYSNAVACVKKVTDCDNRKEFNDRAESFAFVQRANDKNKSLFGSDNTLTEIRIDSTFTK